MITLTAQIKLLNGDTATLDSFLDNLSSRYVSTDLGAILSVKNNAICIDIDRRNLLALDVSVFDRGDYNKPSYGIISNTGTLRFNDINELVLTLAQELLLISGQKVEIFLHDTLSKKSELLAVMETTDWNYDNDSKVVSVSLQDDLVEWQDIQIEGLNYDPRNAFKELPNRSMADLYNWLYIRTPVKYNMLIFEELDNNTQQVLTSTTVAVPYLNAGNLWEQWAKLCQVCALYIYKDKDRTICSYAYGS